MYAPQGIFYPTKIFSVIVPCETNMDQCGCCSTKFTNAKGLNALSRMSYPGAIQACIVLPCMYMRKNEFEVLYQD